MNIYIIIHKAEIFIIAQNNTIGEYCVEIKIGQIFIKFNHMDEIVQIYRDADK